MLHHAVEYQLMGDLVYYNALKSSLVGSVTAKLPNQLTHCSVATRGVRSHVFSLRVCSCSKMFEFWSGSGNFSNLRIRLPFRLRLPPIQPKFAMFLLKKRPRRLLLLLTLNRDSGSGSVFSHIFESGSKRKIQNPTGVDSGTADPWQSLVATHSKMNPGFSLMRAERETLLNRVSWLAIHELFAFTTVCCTLWS